MPRTSASRGWSCGNRYWRYSPGTGSGLPGVVADDPAGQHAEAVDFDLDRVARLQQPLGRAGVADPGRRAGGQQVARPQGEGSGDVREGVADGVDHLVGRALLHDLAVDPGLHPQAVAQVADLGRRHQRADRAGVSPFLPRIYWDVSFCALRAVRSMKVE